MVAIINVLFFILFLGIFLYFTLHFLLKSLAVILYRINGLKIK